MEIDSITMVNLLQVETGITLMDRMVSLMQLEIDLMAKMAFLIQMETDLMVRMVDLIHMEIDKLVKNNVNYKTECLTALILGLELKTA